jgi:hypothetical protein
MPIEEYNQLVVEAAIEARNPRIKAYFPLYALATSFSK